MPEPIAMVTLAVIALTVGTSSLAFRRPDFDLQEQLIFCPQRILAGREIHRLFSHALLHADWRHLIFNMISLYLFGETIELIFGPFIFLAIYAGGILGGGLLSLLLHRHHEYTAYGASGGVCGVIFASIFLAPGGSIYSFPIPFPIPAWMYAILFLGGSFYALRNRNDGIGHGAHLGGAISGLLIATALHPWIVKVSPLFYAATLTLSILFMIWLLLNPLFLPLQAFHRPRHSRKFSPGTAPPRFKGDLHETDRILEKVSAHGLDSLSDQERKHLRNTADLHQRRRELS